MGLLDTIRSMLGLSATEPTRRNGTGGVTVGDDPDVPDATDGSTDGVTTDDEDAVERPVAAGTDAAASTNSIVDETSNTPAEAAEPAEATTPPEPSVDPEAGGAVASDAAVDGMTTERVDDPRSGDAAEGDEAAESETVEHVRGIGPAYASRLSDTGVETVADLAAADPAVLADSVAVAESRVERWVDRAADHESE